jgi:hypothetical protein
VRHLEFVQSLEVLEEFKDILEPGVYRPLPDDWWIAITDVTNSTQAIDQGRYKEVNAVGAISVMAVLNLVGDFQIPFMFGGDGATLLIPPELRDAAARSLLGIRSIAASEFKLDLRVGMVPMSHIRAQGLDVGVARLRISEYFNQAVFTGKGIAFAEAAVKSDQPDAPFVLSGEGLAADADVTGLECRWQNIPSTKGEIIALIVESDDVAEYERVIAKIREIFGDDDLWKPIDETLLQMTWNNRFLSIERRIRTVGASVLTKIRYWVHMRIMKVTGDYLMRKKIRTQTTDWGVFKTDLSNNTDFKKFDGVIRLVMSGTVAQRERLEEWLSIRYSQGKLVYGLNSSPTAMITCLLFGYMKNHVHFVDGSAGGYTKAAAALKRRKKARSDAAGLDESADPVRLLHP